MARDETAMMERGQFFTFYQDDGTTVDSTGGAHLEGCERVFEDLDYSQYGVKPARSNKKVTCRLVRNASGGTLGRALFAQFKTNGTTADVLGGQVSGVGDTVGQIGGVVDEFITESVPANALFWLVIEGPSTMIAANGTDINAGLNVIPTTGGKFIAQDTTVAAGAATFNQIQGAIGRLTLQSTEADNERIVLVRRMA